MSEDNKARFCRIIEEIFSQGKVEETGALIDPKWGDRNPVVGHETEGTNKIVTTYRDAFPDLNLNVDLLMADGDLVAGRLPTTGTHKDEFMGVAPTNNRLTMTEVHIFRFAHGTAVKHWGNGDDLRMMQHLGIIPPNRTV